MPAPLAPDGEPSAADRQRSRRRRCGLPLRSGESPGGRPEGLAKGGKPPLSPGRRGGHNAVMSSEDSANPNVVIMAPLCAPLRGLTLRASVRGTAKTGGQRACRAFPEGKRSPGLAEPERPRRHGRGAARIGRRAGSASERPPVQEGVGERAMDWRPSREPGAVGGAAVGAEGETAPDLPRAQRTARRPAAPRVRR